jgi:hypothetical protein
MVKTNKYGHISYCRSINLRVYSKSRGCSGYDANDEDIKAGQEK